MQKLFARRSVLALAFGLVVIAWPERAKAYCQATTVQASLVCPSSCVLAGTKVAWRTPEIEYAFNMRGFAGLDDAAVRAAIAASFAAWEGVSCDGQLLGFRFAELAQPTDLTVGPLESEPNLNVISLLNATEWQQLGFGATEFARTKVWFDQHTGEIVGADIAFNGAIMPLTVCADEEGCAPDAVDLQNVATHEIGHFLGLAHSADLSSTMWCAAERGDHQKRTLESDDELGLCAVYESGAVFLDHPALPAMSNTPAPHEAAGCSISLVPTGPAHASWLVCLFFTIAAIGSRRVLREMLLRRRSDPARGS